MENKTDQVPVKINDQYPFSDKVPCEMVMVPVAEEDYEKVNQFTEALILTRYPALATEIQQLRKELYLKHNKK